MAEHDAANRDEHAPEVERDLERARDADQAERVARIQRELDSHHLRVVVGEAKGTLLANGRVADEERMREVVDILRRNAGGLRIENYVELEHTLPETGPTPEPLRTKSLTESGDLAPISEMTPDDAALVDADFDAVPLETNDIDVVDDTVYDEEDPVEPDPAYFPVTDPVFTVNNDANIEVANGFEPTSDLGMRVDRSAEDPRPGDEALADAVSNALLNDAATTALAVDVTVENGVVHLRGRVADLTDAESAEEVAGRVPGVRDVVEELDVENM